jgi:type I restriction enzyme M protein
MDLASDIMKACDIMRGDDGTTGMLEYMEQLSWLIFLKIFEDIEKRLEDEQRFVGEPYQVIVGREFRWSSWAKKDWPGEKLIKFIDGELFPYLRSLSGTPEREKIAMIFNEISANRMKSPYKLKDVIELIDKIDFNNLEDSHVVSQIYEDLLLRMGKEGGLAGEFYTPRSIVRLMVKIVNPQIGQTIIDPFCGSCGFLVESYKHMTGSKELTVEDYETLQRRTFRAQEKKSLPCLMGIMNCMLHGLLTPDVVRKNTLEDNIRNIPETERFDIILTNPPFGGKEGKQVQDNFPVQSQATELLALQYVMKKLRLNGRCGIVVPEGALSGGDAFAEVIKELLSNFNVHTIISLPSGTFANVTSVGPGPKANLLFFDRTRETREVWYYELTPSGGANYTKTNPVRDEDLVDCWTKWQAREISVNSWTVPVQEVVARNYDLVAMNPNREERIKDLPIPAIIEVAANRETQIQGLVSEIQAILKEGIVAGGKGTIEWAEVSLKDLLTPVSRDVKVERNRTYRILGMHGYGNGLFVKYELSGSKIKASKLYQVRRSDFVYNRLFGWRGAFGVVVDDFDGCFVSNEFPCFTVKSNVALPEFLWKSFSRPSVWRQVELESRGTTRGSRLRFKQDRLMRMKIRLPPVETQARIVGVDGKFRSLLAAMRQNQADIKELSVAVLEKAFMGML